MLLHSWLVESVEGKRRLADTSDSRYRNGRGSGAEEGLDDILKVAHPPVAEGVGGGNAGARSSTTSTVVGRARIDWVWRAWGNNKTNLRFCSSLPKITLFQSS